MADIGIGVIGYGFMGRAHANGYRKAVALLGAPSAQVVAVAGRGEGVEEFARRWDVPRVYRDWQDLIADSAVTLVDCCLPHRLHPAVVQAAVAAGKHVLCEKPLALDAGDARAMWRAAVAAGVVHMTSFNYRFLPAVRRARTLLASGAMGAVREVHALYWQQGAADARRAATWKWDRAQGGAGALLDLGVHAIDLIRWLAGEPETAMALEATFTHTRPAAEDPQRSVPIDVDDTSMALLQLQGGSVATLHASRVAWGRKNRLSLEIHAEKGSLLWDLERCNELMVCEASAAGGNGFQTILVEPDLPEGGQWWPPGHVYGWEDGFSFALAHLLRCIAAGRAVTPEAADFEDGYRAVLVAEAIARAARLGQAVAVAGGGGS